MIILIVKRLASSWALITAILLGITVASSLAVGAPVYLETLNRMSLNTSFDRVSDQTLKIRSFIPFVPLRADKLELTDNNFEEIKDTYLSNLGLETVRHLRTDSMLLGTESYPLPSPETLTIDSPKGYFQVLSGIESKIRIVEGTLASDQPIVNGLSLDLEAVVASDLAAFFEVSVGDEVLLARSPGSTDHVRVLITGLIEPIDGRDNYWPLGANLFRIGTLTDDSVYQLDRFIGIDDEAAELFEDAEVQTELGLFVSQKALLKTVAEIFPSTFSTIDFYVGVDKSSLKQLPPDDIKEIIAGFEASMADKLVGTSIFTGISGVLVEFDRRSFFSSIPLLLLLGVMVLISIYYLYMMVSYLVDGRSGDVSALRARGTSLLQLARTYAVEGLLLVAIPSVVVPFLVIYTVRISGKLTYFRDFTQGELLPVIFNFTPFIVALGSALLCLLIFVVPGIFGGRVAVIAHKLRLARPPSLPLFQRYYLDVGLLALGGLLFWEIHARGQLISGGLFEELQINESLLLAPVLLLVVVALVFMRFFPLVIRFISGESATLTHIWVLASSVLISMVITVQSIKEDYNFDWAPQVLALIVIVFSYLVTVQKRNRNLVAFSLLLQTIMTGFFIWYGLAFQNFMLIPTLFVTLIVPLQLVYLFFQTLARLSPVWLSMTLLHMSRNPLQYMWMMLLLVLLTGLGLLATTAGATLDRSQQEQIRYDLATDIHVSRLSPSPQMGHVELKDTIESIPEITSIALAHRTLGEVGEQSSRAQFPFLALESQEFSKIAWFREDFSRLSLDSLLYDLELGARPESIELPENAAGIGIWVKPARPYPSIFAMASIEDRNGLIETVNFGTIPDGGWQLLSSGLPESLEAPVSLLSFQIFEYVYGPSGTPGEIMIDNIYAAMPDGPPVILENFEDKNFWTPIKVSLSMTDEMVLVPDSSFPGSTAGLYRFGKDTDFGMRGVFRLTKGGRIPVIVSNRFAQSTGVSVGDSFVVSISSRRMPVTVKNVLEYFPTLEPDGIGFMIGEMDTFLRYINMIGPSLRFTPNEIFAATTPDGQSSAISGMTQMDIDPSQIESTELRLAQTRVDPLIIAGWKLMVLISVAFIMCLSATAYAVYLLSFMSKSRGEVGTLITLGLTRNQLLGLLSLEHIVIVVIGLALGSWAGFEMSQIMVSTLAVTETGEAVIPPFVLNTQWSYMLPIYFVLLGLLLLALVAIYQVIGRLKLHEVSRVEV